MIINDTIAIIIGWFVIYTFLFSILALLNWFIIEKLFRSSIEWKSLGYAIASNMKKFKDNEHLMSQITLKVGRKWWVRYKGKDYSWECIREEEVKK